MVRPRSGLHQLYLVLTATLASACAGISTFQGTSTTLESVVPPGWIVHAAKGNTLPVMMAHPQRSIDLGMPLLVYIEGDGYAWRRKNLPSNDPTPKKPIGLRLSRLTPDNFNTAYLARPCQFIDDAPESCEPAVWTSHRYSNENVRAISTAIDQLLGESSQRLVLVGYSGGGVIAGLLAASRSDVAGFITIAANLDIDYWTALHSVSPLSGSQSPLEHADRLASVPQLHFAGAEDEVVPASVVESYLDALGLNNSAHLVTIQRYNHHCCWEDNWPQLLNNALVQINVSEKK